MNLSNHFTLKEFTDSEKAIELGIDNTKPTPQQISKMVILCNCVLEEVRIHFNKPVDISSGFRCKALNDIISKSKTSQHQYGEAADIVIAGIDPIEIFRFIRDNLEYDQVIYENTWVHVSFREGNNRRQPLIFRSGQNPLYVDGSKL